MRWLLYSFRDSVMSALAGIYHLDGAEVNGRILATLGDKLNARNPDGGGEIKLGCIGMTYRAFHTNRESRFEQQPAVSPDGYVLAWDGRLDNRNDLLRLLSNNIQGHKTDAAIVISAYREWGGDCWARLIGDFALSMWDPTLRTLFLVRDPVGTRTLYYHLGRDCILWSSELEPFLGLPGIDLDVNDEYVAGYLTGEPELGLTPYESIRSVPPGNVFTVCKGQCQMKKFWELNPNYEIRYKKDLEYEEHFRDIFREAVRCRLRAEGMVWSQLSGGFDSSSIVCMADKILKQGEAEAAGLETVSYVFDESTLSDERKYISCVEEQRGKIGCHLLEEDYRTLASFPGEPSIRIPSFLHCFAQRHRRLCEAMNESGARILLTGHGGDQLLWSGQDPSPELSDLVIQCKLFDLHHRIKIWNHTLKKSYLELLWSNAVLPVLPLRLQNIFQNGLAAQLPSWFSKKFVAQMDLRGRKLGQKKTREFSLPSMQEQSAGFSSVVRFVSAGYFQECGGIEISYPYLHRPLVEFLQAIPFEQMMRPEEPRSLQRRAMRELLPEKIAMRKGKRSIDEVINRAIGREWSKLKLMFEDARVCTLGYMDAEALLAALHRAKHGCEVHSFALIKTISLELWLRSLEYRKLEAKNFVESRESIIRSASVYGKGDSVSVPSQGTIDIRTKSTT